ncbi:MAG: DUF4013 domain-containing protein [Candidatus Altiarchaeota archaeon]|nr:DUF4013 domain-containing protein [Candidatus Altiarchaeota archaeon]
MEVTEILKKPFSDAGKFVTGVVLGGIPILDFFVLGFGLENAKNPKELPNFNPQQFFLGFKAKVVGFVYSLIQVLFLVAFVVAFGGVDFWQTALKEMASAATLGPLIMTTFGVPGFSAFVLLSLFVIYISTYAILEVARTGEIKSAFHMKKILKESFTREFAKIWAYAFLLQFVVITLLSIVLIPLWWVPVLGVGIVNYVSTVVFWTFLGSRISVK